MNVTLELSLEAAERLRERAVQGGQSLEAYLLRLVECDVIKATGLAATKDNESDEDRPWRGVCVLPRPRRPLFVVAPELPNGSLRRRTPNLNWLRADVGDE